MSEQRALTSKTHAVLKLNLGERGTRRISFSRLWQGKSESVSYDKLVGLALEYSFPEDAPHDQSKYEVCVTYLDEDGDSITISSDVELSEAFSQFIDDTPPVLRASAKVKRAVTDEDPTETKSSCKEDPKITPGDEHTGRPYQTTSGEANEINESPPLEIIAKSLSSLVASAVSFRPNPNPNTDKHVASSDAADSSSERKITEEAEKFVREVIDNIKLSTSNNNVSSGPTESEQFLHGRHTCDGCKQKPIVGLRYHALNKHDFDLCESCYQTRVDKSTIFAATELERDRSHQSRWRSVYLKNSKDKKGDGAPSKLSDANTAVNDDTSGLDQKFIHGRHTCDSCLQTPIIGLRYHALNLPDYDLCQNCVHNYKGNEIKFKPVELDRDRPLQHRWQRRQMRRARQAQLSNHGVRRMCPSKYTAPCGEVTQVMDLALKEAIRRSLLEVSPKPPSATDDSLEEISGDANVEAATQLSAEDPTVEKQEDESEALKMEIKGDECNSEGPTNTTVPFNEKKATEKEVEAIADEKDEESVQMDVSASKSAGIAELTTPSRQKRPPKVLTPASAVSRFSEDAAGIGEAAEAIGATLDACAGAIDAIVSEFDKEPCAEDSPKEIDSVSAMTSSIPSINGVTQNDECMRTTNFEADDWEVVDEDTGALAKATEVVGSALFESGKDTTVSSNPSVDSIPSSVPTISSPTPPTLRWSSELKQLHILGFTNDNRSIDALERLEAANTGSSDPITVDDVINFLLSQNTSS